MSDNPLEKLKVEIVCATCKHTKVFSASELIKASNGLLAENDFEFQEKLLESLPKNFVCSQCKGKAVQFLIREEIKPIEEEFELAKICIQCEKPIPIERLEAVPGTVRCVSCQGKLESGETDKPKPVFCKKCKSVMVWRMTKNIRPAKYFLGCSNYPKCTYIGVGSF